VTGELCTRFGSLSGDHCKFTINNSKNLGYTLGGLHMASLNPALNSAVQPSSVFSIRQAKPSQAETAQDEQNAAHLGPVLQDLQDACLVLGSYPLSRLHYVQLYESEMRVDLKHLIWEGMAADSLKRSTQRVMKIV
jgi:hypothetical protein